MKIDETTVEEFEKLEHTMRRALGGQCYDCCILMKVALS